MQSQPGTRPGTLIRTPEGRITFWSEELQCRYGFSAEQALGRVSHELLRASHWQSRDEIEALLKTHAEWRGGLIVYRADDQPVIVGNHWHLHGGSGGMKSLVTEVHADIVTSGTAAGDEMADIVTTFAQELSQPLAAIGGFMSGAQRAVRSTSTSRSVLERGLSEAMTQLDRARGIITRIRALGETLRDPRLREPHAEFAGSLDRSERVMRDARDAQAADSMVLDSSAAAQQQTRNDRADRQRARQSGAMALERGLALQSIQVYHRRLAALRSEPRDPQAERVLTQLLGEAEAKLIALDQAASARG